MLAYVQASSIKVEKIQKGLFHKPLLLTLVNSVNIEEADLKIFFAELERIAKGKVSASNWRVAKEELWEELKKKPPYFFEEGKLFEANAALFDKIDLEWLREHVFYSKGTGDIEVLVRPSNKQEIAFKLKTTDRPFALIRIGDISNWLKETLAHYEVLDSFEDEGFLKISTRKNPILISSWVQGVSMKGGIRIDPTLLISLTSVPGLMQKNSSFNRLGVEFVLNP